ncbi:hypothetical protein Leryth_011811 [Lithospermum erythrorhizon]|nr:hypothetical protein Leryth_011811 [Lithospermum erythrorhizon]
MVPLFQFYGQRLCLELSFYISRVAERNDAEDQPPAKRRLSSAVVKLEEGEISEDVTETGKDIKKDDRAGEESNGNGNGNGNVNGNARLNGKQTNWLRRDAYQRPIQKLQSRFKKDDIQRSPAETDSRGAAEQRAREESERLRQQEREEIAEKRKRDLVCSVCLLIAMMFSVWQEKQNFASVFDRLSDVLRPRKETELSEHHKKLKYKNADVAELAVLQEIDLTKTKAEPPIYYTFAKPMDEDTTLVEEQKEQPQLLKCQRNYRSQVQFEIYQEWKTARREDLSEYQKQVAERYLANVDKELERWQNMRKGNQMM